MRSTALRQLQPFFTAVDGYAKALARDTTSCRCELTAAGRWAMPTTGCPLGVVHHDERPPTPTESCRSLVHLVLRAHLAQLHMPVDHITDPELDEAVSGLQELCLNAPTYSTEMFAEGIQRALHADRVAGNRS